MNAHQLNVSLCSPVVSQYVNKDVRSRRDSDSERFAFNNSPKNSCCLRRRPNDTNRKLQQELHGIFTNTQAQKWQASFFYFCSSSRLSFLRFCKKKKKKKLYRAVLHLKKGKTNQTHGGLGGDSEGDILLNHRWWMFKNRWVWIFCRIFTGCNNQKQLACLCIPCVYPWGFCAWQRFTEFSWNNDGISPPSDQ